MKHNIKKAMILAAGEGRRMRPLTLHTPKPLLCVHGVPLIVHHIRHLVQLGIGDIVINVAYLGEQIEAALGDGAKWNAKLSYSYESQPLETAGAINKALPLLGSAPFLLVNGDVWLPDGFSEILHCACMVTEQNCLGVLGLVENPEHNLGGDFGLANDLIVGAPPSHDNSYTFSGVSILSPAIIKDYPQTRLRFALKEVFMWAMDQQQLKGKVFTHSWVDVGTPARLEALNEQ